MLVKYKVDYTIPFKDFNYYELQNEILKKVNQKYPTKACPVNKSPLLMS